LTIGYSMFFWGGLALIMAVWVIGFEVTHASIALLLLVASAIVWGRFASRIWRNTIGRVLDRQGEATTVTGTSGLAIVEEPPASFTTCRIPPEPCVASRKIVSRSWRLDAGRVVGTSNARAA